MGHNLKRMGLSSIGGLHNIGEVRNPLPSMLWLVSVLVIPYFV